MSFKKTKVVMLSTNEKAKHGDLTLTPSDSQKVTVFNGFLSSQLAQYLYFLSDDEIKEGDWFYLDDANIVAQYTTVKPINQAKKIIATTDKNLIWLDESEKNLELARPNGLWKCLPQPSEGFIQKFVDAYNSGNPITEVDVEYERVKQALSIISKKTKNGSDYTEVEWEFQDILKINPKDNTITIKKVKDSWNRDEVVTLILQSNLDSHVAKEGEFDIMHWIEKNL